ncbi:MAG: T9SS type A sorting domain-containing protein, partial [Candidatus Marinimicrobia bacterium]|nr:T9SS type A sorting domain-containing protein [Candidatus Neomarinimicrobiota bacterium]
NNSAFISAPIVIDIDSDNDLEIIGASVNHLSMYDIKTPGSTLSYWNLYRGNNRRTGYESGDECSAEFDNCGVCGGDGSTCLAVNDLIKADKFSLSSIYPNPFNPVTKIDFSIPIYELVTIIAYDIKGRAIETLINKKLQPDTYSINWYASAHPSGIYLIKMKSGNYSHTQKVILIK